MQYIFTVQPGCCVSVLSLIIGLENDARVQLVARTDIHGREWVFLTVDVIRLAIRGRFGS